MKCSQVQEMLSAYHDGELDDDAQSQVSDHLAECSRCASELNGFQSLSRVTETLRTPAPPEMWGRLEDRMDRRRRIFLSHPSVAKGFALAAMVLLALGVFWFANPPGRTPDAHEFASEFETYLDEFDRDPDAAQQMLLTKYENQPVSPDKVGAHVGYRPAVADGLPGGYELVSTHVLKMPCCTCVQSVCRRPDGSTLAVFEHDDDEAADWFQNRPGITAPCGDKQCCLVEMDERLATTWKRGSRHMTLVGVRDVSEVATLVAALDVPKS